MPDLRFEATGDRVPFEMLKERDVEREAEETEKLEMIRTLRDEGKTLQEIADMLGYSNRCAVHRILKRNT